MRSGSVLLLALLLLTVTGPAAANPHLERGIQLLHDMEDAKALLELQQALGVAGSDAKQRALIHVHIGIARFNLLRTDEAKESFRAALELDSKATLPAMTSPKIHEVFEAIRAELRPAQAPTTAPTPPIAPPPTVTTRAAPGVGRYWPAFAALGLAAAAGVAGLSCGLLARSSEESAGDLKLSYGAAKEHHDAATTRALAANVMFGIAGAAAVTSAVLFLVLRPGKAERRAASVVPLPSGAALQVQATW